MPANIEPSEKGWPAAKRPHVQQGGKQNRKSDQELPSERTLAVWIRDMDGCTVRLEKA